MTNSIEQRINELMASMTAEQIRKVMTAVKTASPTQVDMKYKLRRIRTTELYHNSAPKPHQCDDYDSYVNHSDSIREQVMQG